jgi:hypothetical protein
MGALLRKRKRGGKGGRRSVVFLFVLLFVVGLIVLWLSASRCYLEYTWAVDLLTTWL